LLPSTIQTAIGSGPECSIAHPQGVPDPNVKREADWNGNRQRRLQVGPAGHIPVHEHLRTNIANIFGFGKLQQAPGFSHTAFNDFEIVAVNLLEGQE
jgi:thioredoxin reductase